jgi:hypothetical protein
MRLIEAAHRRDSRSQIEVSDMGNTLQSLMESPVVMIVLIFFAAWLIGHSVGELRKYACHRNDVELKRDLAARGLSADEIERIVAAKSSAVADEVEAEDGELVAK